MKKYEFVSVWFNKELLPHLNLNVKPYTADDSYGFHVSYINDIADEEIYNLCKGLIYGEMPIMFIMNEEGKENMDTQTVSVLRFHGESDVSYNKYGYPKLNDKEKEMLKIYKLMEKV